MRKEIPMCVTWKQEEDLPGQTQGTAEKLWETICSDVEYRGLSVPIAVFSLFEKIFFAGDDHGKAGIFCGNPCMKPLAGAQNRIVHG